MIKKKKRWIISMYLGFMLIFYLGYISLDHYRLNQSEQRGTAHSLTPEDVHSIQQLGNWVSTFEFLFIGLWILAAIFLFRYRKNKQTLVHFIILHLILCTGIFLLGYGLSFLLTAPIGNLTQPLVLPVFLLVIVMIYTLFMMMKERLSHHIR